MKQPEIQCALKIYFENDYDVNEITKILGVKPTNSANYLDAGYTRTTNIKRAGYWWYIIPSCRDYQSCWKLSEILTELFMPFSEQQLEWLKEIKKRHDGKIVIDINVFVKNDFPEMCLDGKNMRIIHDLEADVNLNLNRDEENDD